MFGLSDSLGVRTSNEMFQSGFLDRSEYFRITPHKPIIRDATKVLWLCFPGFLKPRLDLANDWGDHNLFPKQGTAIVITGPDAIAGYTPQDTVEGMERLTAEVQNILDRYKGFELRVFSISAGTFPGFYFANTYRAASLVAVAPGPRMGEGIYTSVFSKTLREFCVDAGYPTAKSYDDVISKYNQENNVEHLPPDGRTIIFGARCDRVIRNWGTVEIVRRCVAARKSPTFYNYSMLGHRSLGMWLAVKNKLGYDPYFAAQEALSCKRDMPAY